MRAIGGDLQNRNLLYWPRAMATVTWEEASLDYSAIASLLAASAADIKDEVEVTTEATHAFAFNLARPRHAGLPTALTLAPWAASARCGWGMPQYVNEMVFSEVSALPSITHCLHILNRSARISPLVSVQVIDSL